MWGGPIDNHDAGEAGRLLQALVGLRVVSARLCPVGGSLVRVELSDHAEICTDDAAWRIESDEVFLVATEDHRDHIRDLVLKLDGRRVTSVAVSEYLDLTVDFEGWSLINVVVSTADPYCHWSVRLPSGVSVTAGPGSSWSCEPPSAMPSHEE